MQANKNKEILFLFPYQHQWIDCESRALTTSSVDRETFIIRCGVFQ